MKTITISEFTTTPGPRYIRQGDHSGEEFRETRLKPLFQEAQSSNEPLRIDLTGVRFGYPTSFLEEAFGGLARVYDQDVVQRVLIFHSPEEPALEAEIRNYIATARDTKLKG